MHITAAAPGPGKFYEIMDYEPYAWPGHGVAPEHFYQSLEEEFMKAKAYDLLITDPSFHFYLPRALGVLEGFTMLPPPPTFLRSAGLLIISCRMASILPRTRP